MDVDFDFIEMMDANCPTDGIHPNGRSADNAASSPNNLQSGAYRDRTGDPQLAKLVLSQLS